SLYTHQEIHGRVDLDVPSCERNLAYVKPILESHLLVANVERFTRGSHIVVEDRLRTREPEASSDAARDSRLIVLVGLNCLRHDAKALGHIEWNARRTVIY